MIMRSMTSNFCTLVSEALVSSGPPWQLMHLPWPRKTSSPRCSWSLRGEGVTVRSASMNRSKRVSSAIRVFSYSLTARPKYKEKLYSITVNWLGPTGPEGCSFKTGVPLERSTTQPGANHHCGWKTFLIRSVYLRVMPLVPGEVFCLLKAPSRLSSVATSCCPRATRLEDSSFLPTSANLRPAKDISRLLSGGPSAWEAADKLGMRTETKLALPDTTWTTLAVGSRAPMGFTPLNSLRARESQKLRWLSTVLMTVGVLRGSTLRTSAPLMLKTAPGPMVEATPMSKGIASAVKSALKTPMEEATSLVSARRGEAWLLTSNSL